MRQAFVAAVAEHGWFDHALRDQAVAEAQQLEGGKEWLLGAANWVLHECIRGTSVYHDDLNTAGKIDTLTIRAAADAYLAAELAANIRGAKTKHYAQFFMALGAALQSGQDEHLCKAASEMAEALRKWANKDERRVALLKGPA